MTEAEQFVHAAMFALVVLGVPAPMSDAVTKVWDYAPEETYIHWREFTDGSQAVLLRSDETWEVL